MNQILTMELGAEFLKAAGFAWLCFLWGVVALKSIGDSKHGERLGKGLILLAPFTLTMFGQWSVRQYNVVLAKNQIPFSEVADNGGRVHLTGIDSLTFPGLGRVEWTRTARSGLAAGHRAVLSGGQGSRATNQRTPLDSCCLGGCSCETGGMPCCCTGTGSGCGCCSDGGFDWGSGQRY